MENSFMLFNGDCLEVLKKFPDNSVDSLVTDPPAGISFMGKEWDSNKGGSKEWIEWMTSVMKECLRVMKPGAHGLVWALPRTSHWTGNALERAGFEVRDVITHLFGTGFPKSLNISKAIDKAAGAEREIVGINPSSRPNSKIKESRGFDGQLEGFESAGTQNLTKPTTLEAKTWDGWGTALKPACEFWFLVRKPLSEDTVAANVLKWGTGGLNIDGCRIDVTSNDPNHRKATGKNGGIDSMFGVGNSKRPATLTQGRFPSNLLLDETAAQMLDEQSGTLISGSRSSGVRKGMGFNGGKGDGGPAIKGNTGGASRFFYVAKAAASEKNRGIEKNTHPTVKALKLMEYLLKLVTPPSGIVLDPFMGSGSTGVAARGLSFYFLGIEKEVEYFEIARKRVEGAVSDETKPKKDGVQGSDQPTSVESEILE